MMVIPSRVDDEGPHNYALTHTKCRANLGNQCAFESSLRSG
jgi:hypothetical protein